MTHVNGLGLEAIHQFLHIKFTLKGNPFTNSICKENKQWAKKKRFSLLEIISHNR